MLHPESEAINRRFFQAIDELILRRKLRGKKTFATRYELNWGNFFKLRADPSMGFELAYLTFLVRDFGISSQWLLTGEGPMFQADKKSQPPKP